MRIRAAIFSLLLLTSAFSFAQTGEQKFAELGTCPLENGKIIQSCSIGYRTFGSLNRDRSNAVLVTTWFLGNSQQVAGSFVGANSVLDPAKYFVVVVDALGNGVSSSPSKSHEQPRMSFPNFNIRDLVNTQHRLLTETLHLTHVRAVLGASMGGMQALQWAYSYPDFMDRVVAIVPTPRLTSYDLLLWRAELNAIQSDIEWRGGEYTGTPMMKTAIDIHNLHMQTPSKMVEQYPPSAFPLAAEKMEQDFHFDPNDEIRQLEAMMAQDVAPGKTFAEMGKMLKPRTLIVVSQQDQMVNPTPATALAKASSAQLIELTSNCGHLAPGCESDKVNPAVKAFLDKP